MEFKKPYAIITLNIDEDAISKKGNDARLTKNN